MTPYLFENRQAEENAIALAREMINRFGGLNGLMMATSENLLGNSPFIINRFAHNVKNEDTTPMVFKICDIQIQSTRKLFDS